MTFRCLPHEIEIGFTGKGKCGKGGKGKGKIYHVVRRSLWLTQHHDRYHNVVLCDS